MPGCRDRQHGHAGDEDDAGKHQHETALELEAGLIEQDEGDDQAGGWRGCGFR